MSAHLGTPADDPLRFERAVRYYAQIGLAPERAVKNLLRAGFPLPQVRTQYPTLPEDLFVVPADARSITHSTTILPSSKATSSGQGTTKLLPSAQSIAQRVLAKTAANAPPIAALPSATAVSSDLTDGLSFQYVPLIQCSFPHADPGDAATFTRRNGWLELTLSATRRDMGLPYGVPARLLTIYCASEAIRTRSPEIYLGRSVQDFLRCLDVPITRGDRGSLRVYAHQLLRLIHCALSIDENMRDAKGRTGLHIRQALFAEEARLWWDEADGVGQGSSLVLSSVLFESILERSAPLSTAAIRQLRKSPMDLDVYAWLVHRLYQLSRPSTMTWAQLSGQFGHSYGEIRYFRRFFGDSLKRVLKVYPEAKFKWTDAGVILLPSKPHVERSISASP
jgi:hypothetical protein